MIENAIFPYKTAVSKANVKENKRGSTKCTCQKKRSFVITVKIRVNNYIP